jgi:hypothetical protein
LAPAEATDPKGDSAVQIKGTALGSAERYVREHFGAKVFFKVGSPQFIISRVAKVWRTTTPAAS